MVKKFKWKLWNMENGHSEDDIFHTFSKTENFKRTSFIIKVLLPYNWLEWREKAIAKECCGYFSHPLGAYDKTSPGQSSWTSRYCCWDLSKNLQQEFL